MSVPYGTPLTAPRVTTGGYADGKQLTKEGRHVGLDFYDLLIEGDYAHKPVNECNGDVTATTRTAQRPSEWIGP
jgi:hypothetical protein